MHPRQTTSTKEPGSRSVYGFRRTGTTGTPSYSGLPGCFGFACHSKRFLGPACRGPFRCVKTMRSERVTLVEATVPVCKTVWKPQQDHPREKQNTYKRLGLVLGLSYYPVSVRFHKLFTMALNKACNLTFIHCYRY